jgi:hypothetical protein
MSRLALFSATLLGATGCLWYRSDTTPASDTADTSGDLAPQTTAISAGRLSGASTFEIDLDGVYAPDAADYAVAGMAGMTCQYFTSLGYTGMDVDVDANHDDHVDGGRLPTGDEPDGTVVLGHGTDRVFELSAPDGTVLRSWWTPGVVGAAYVAGSVAVLRDHDGCTLRSGEHDIAVPAHFCARPSLVPAGDDLVLVDGQGALVVVGGAARAIAVHGENAGWDSQNQRLIVSDGATVTAVTVDGSAVWSADLGAPIAGLVVTNGEVLVSSGGGVASALTWLDGAGAVTSAQEVGRPAGRLYASNDGRTVIETGGGWTDAFTGR